MRIKKRMTALFLAVCLTAVFGAASVPAQETAVSEQPAEGKVYFKSFTGTVKEVTDYVLPDGKEAADKKFVLVEGEDGEVVNFLQTENTYLVDDFKVSAGSKVVCFYDATRPVILIYPPQYEAEVIAELKDEWTVKADRFDEDLVSADNDLKLNISDETEIFLQNGEPFDGELAGRKLVVIYDISTRSIPAQTNPKKVIVLNENIVPPTHDITDEEFAELPGTDNAEEEVAVSEEIRPYEIVVNGRVIEGAEPFTDEEGNVMLPLRAVLDELSIPVAWNAVTKEISVGNNISFKPGANSYSHNGLSLALEADSVLNEGRTFVPLSFFKNILSMNNAHVLEAQVVIDGGEVME